MSSQAVTVTEDSITILAEYFATKEYACTNKEWLLDIFSTHYTGQAVIVDAHDGENLIDTGFLKFLEQVCEIFGIDKKSIVIYSHNPRLSEPFTFRQKTLTWFINANQHIPKFEQRLDNAQFVGALIGRFTPTRLRLLYELDQAFPGDVFSTFQSKFWWHHQPFVDLYQQEQQWFNTKTFDTDLQSSAASGRIPPEQAYQSYPNCWNRYLIEVICETDPFGDFWFTEKTAKPVATGKPFMLVAGTGSLQQLKEMGFQTFDSVIDESYDSELTPTKRIKAIVSSLQELYNSPDRSKRIDAMYEIARCNQEHYKNYVSKH